jgi:hypothetical protein
MPTRSPLQECVLGGASARLAGDTTSERRGVPAWHAEIPTLMDDLVATWLRSQASDWRAPIFLEIQMTNRGIQHALRAGRHCVATMRDNASYIQGELASVSLPDGVRARVVAACTDLADAADRASRVLDDIGSLSESPSAAAKIRGTYLADVVVSVQAETVKMHEVVVALRDAAATDMAHAPGCVLVEESAANILQAFCQFRDAASAVGRD